MKAIFVHLTGSHRENTEVFISEKISIGTDTGDNLRFDPDIDRNTSHFSLVLKNRLL